MSFAVYMSEIHNPVHNFAFEEALFHSDRLDGPVLLLWVNAPCVVIGRHQNPWREVALKALYEDGIPLIRRMSGGGTVYHDLGNLNYSFIASGKQYNEHENFQMILKALSALGVEANLNQRKDIVVGDFKNSGNAFYMRGNKRLHHGTLLVNTDHHKLWRYLDTDGDAIEQRGIISKKSEVINLSDLDSGISVDRVKKVIVDTVKHFHKDVKIFYGDKSLLTEQQEKVYKNALKRHETWEWRFGETPSFKYYLNASAFVTVEGGRVLTSMSDDALKPLIGIRKKEEKHVY